MRRWEQSVPHTDNVVRLVTDAVVDIEIQNPDQEKEIDIVNVDIEFDSSVYVEGIAPRMIDTLGKRTPRYVVADVPFEELFNDGQVKTIKPAKRVSYAIGFREYDVHRSGYTLRAVFRDNFDRTYTTNWTVIGNPQGQGTV